MRGVWGTTSSDLLFVAGRLFQQSKAESSRYPDKNHSRYVYAGIPLLLAAVRSFAIEYESIGNLGPLPAELADNSTCDLMKSRYGVSGAVLKDLADLTEIRNEIIHPIPRPPGTPDNWPDYLRHIKQKALLSTTGVPDSDFIMLGQIASHKLFA